MAGTQQGVPQLNSSMVDNRGVVTQPWYLFFLNLWQRTGGGTGTDFAPSDSNYITEESDTNLPNAFVATNTVTTAWDFSTAGKAKVNVNISSIIIPESQVTNLLTDLNNRVTTSTAVVAGTGLSGGGILTGNVTLSINSTTATAALNIFTSTLKGVTPASGGGTVNYLRADATFANPLTGGISGSVALAKLTGGGANGSITYTNGLITAVVAPT